MNLKFFIRFAAGLCMLFSVFTALAQSRVVSGVVTGGDDGLPMPRVTVLEKGTNNGTLTDLDGRYSINVSDGSTLIFSFVGYISKEVQVGSQGAVNIVLEVNTTELEEVVVVGYGTVTKKDATGSVAAITTEDFNKGVTPSATDLIVGRLPGVQVTTGGGAPGEGASIFIRGGSSLNASNSPLFVIDGVVLSDEGISGLRNPLSIINPNDIETFTVLKDASATAIYGARASNGVVIITTKRGKEGQQLQVQYNGSFSLSQLPKRTQVLDGDAYRQLVTDLVADGNEVVSSDAADNLGNGNTNWQDQIFETAFATDQNVSATGSVAGVPVRASYGYTNQDGILKKSNFTRHTLSVGLDPKLLDDHLSVQINARGSMAANDFSNQGAIGSAVFFDPTRPVFTESAAFGGYYYWGQPGVDEDNDGIEDPNPQASSNPLALINQTTNTSDVNSLIGNIELDYQFHFMPEFRAHLNLATTRSNTEGLNTVSPEAAFGWDKDRANGTINTYEAEKKNDLLEFYIKYNKDLNFLQSSLEVLGGYSWQHFYRYDESKTLAGDGVQIVTPFQTNASENYLVSFYGRVNYNVMDKYLFTFTLRRDGSSRFAEGRKFGTFPAAAFAWRLKDENFLKNVDVVSDLKLRLGYGITGQENVGSAYPTIPRVVFGNDLARYQFGGVPITTVRFEAFDAKLKWEETTSYGVGVDFGFFNNRLNGSLDYYFKETKDLLAVVPAAAGTNFSNFLLTNVGNIENEGIELALNGVVVDNGDFTWDAGINATRSTNKITKLTLADDPNFTGLPTGGIGGGVGNTVQINDIGYPRSTFNLYEQVYDENGDPIEGLYVDQNNDGIINASDRLRSESPDASLFFGFNSRFGYKNWSLSFNARANFNNYVYNNVFSGSTYSSLYNLDFYGNVVTSIQDTRFSNAQYFSDYYLQNASFFRMDNVTLAHSLGNVLRGVEDLSFSFTVQNAFVITKYDGLDPEVAGGIDNNIFPRPRVFVFGISARF